MPLPRLRLVALAAGAALLLTPLAPAGAAEPGSLDALAAAQGRRFGTAVDDAGLADPAYTTVAAREFGRVTPANAMKWDAVEPRQGAFSFARGDALVDFARAHGQQVRGHTLVWHSQLPGWVAALPAAQVRGAMENHIAQVAGHWKGKIHTWDVVNEPFNDDGTFRTTSPFYAAMGEDYIAYAFRAARAADPDAKLYLNDYNTEGSGAKADAMYRLASRLKAQGVPLDGVGFQVHLATQYGFPYGMQANLQRFADLGLDVAITELDVRMPLPVDAAKTAVQNDYYRRAVEACLGVTRCESVTVWDFTDKYSWVPSAFPGQGSAALYDEQYRPKAAYDAVRQALGGSTTPPDTRAPSAPTGLTATAAGATSATLAWQAATDDTGVTGYDVYRDGARVGSAAATSYTDTGLSPSTAYRWTVRARDAAGNVSAASAEATATTAAGGGGGPGLVVQHRVNDQSATDNQIKPGLRLVNRGGAAADLSRVTLRYWFTGDGGSSAFSAWCDYAAVGCGAVREKVVALPAGRPGADHYLEVSFASGSLAAGASTGEIQLRVNKADWSAFTEADDHSYRVASSYADAPKVTAYVDGVLVHGIEP
ncbi:endo-1,4-beta-xylanase [Streptomyces sp. NPDC048182]|uniref:endo-1,4-beta-xylanase n=1 Tax=Streptomyces sp. NPDC048182 TaxID=3365507 RepID=UPI0037102C55